MILVSGSLAYDRIMNFPGYFRDHLLPEKLHQISVGFLIDTITQHFGGTAGNIAYNLSLLGEKTILLGSAGNDYAVYRAWQKKNGIDTSLVQVIQNKQTATAYIMTDKADNQITGFHPGALAQSTPLSVLSADVLRKIKIAIVSPGNNDDMRALSILCRTNRIPYIYDPGQEISRLSKKDLIDGMTGAKALIVNDYELAMVQKKTGFTKKQLLDKVDILVTTLGEKGSIIAINPKFEIRNPKQIQNPKSKIQSYKIPAVKAKKVVDPTGAGDAYRAGFIHGLLQGWSMEKVGRFAALTAVYTVEKAGTQTHRFSRAVLQRKYREKFYHT